MADEVEIQVAPPAPATAADVERVRSDIAQRLAALTPRTGQMATDLVAVLNAVQGSPSSVHVVTPGAARSVGSYSSDTTGGWSVEILWRPCGGSWEDNQ